MRRGLLALLFVAAAGLVTGCSSSAQTFTVENGLCYRTTVEQRAGCTVSTAKVKALNENCGLPRSAAG